MAESVPVRPGTPIAPAFRAVLGLEVFFNIASLTTVGMFPDQTATKFAWEIKSVVMAAVFGGLYLSVAPTGILQFLARHWEMIRVMILPLIAFTTAELIATLLHLDRFFVGTLRFNVWLASYILPPPLLLMMYLYHEQRSSHPAVSTPLPKALRQFFVLLGTLITADGLLAFQSPSRLVSSFPWALTPLTARVLAGWVIVLGALLLSIARENDRDRVRIASPVLILLLPAVGFQIFRFRDQVDLAHPRIWLNVGIFSILTICGLYLARGSWRASLR